MGTNRISCSATRKCLFHANHLLAEQGCSSTYHRNARNAEDLLTPTFPPPILRSIADFKDLRWSQPQLAQSTLSLL